MKRKLTLLEILNNNYQSKIERKNCLPQFLAVANEIAHAISKGWNLRTIWQALHDAQKFEASYSCFTVYVKTYLKQERLSVKIPSQISTLAAPASENPVKAEQALSVKLSPQRKCPRVIHARIRKHHEKQVQADGSAE